MKKRWKIIGIAVGIISMVLITAGAFFASRMERIILSELSGFVQDNSDGLYKLRVDRLNIKLLNGKIEIKDADLDIDSTVLLRMKRQKTDPELLYSIHVKTIEIGFSGIINTLKSSYLDIYYVDIYKPQVIVFCDSLTASNTPEKNIMANANQTLKRFFSKVDIHAINIHHGLLKYHYMEEQNNSGGWTFSMNDINVQIDEILLDSMVPFREMSLPRIENFQCDIKNISHVFPGKEYALDILSISMNIQESRLILDSIAIVPEYDKFEFAKRTTNKKDRIEVVAQQVILSGIKFHDLLFQNRLYADSLIVNQCYINNFKNKKHPPLVETKKPLFHQLIHKIPIEVDIATILVANSLAEYEHLAIGVEKAGLLRFSDINLYFKGFTNVPVSEKQYCIINGNAKLMNTGRVNLQFSLPLNDGNEKFYLKGTLGKMNLTDFNSMIEPVAHAKMKGGEIDKMEFNIVGTNNVASIDFLFLYHDLKIGVFKKDNTKAGLVSRIVNDYVLIRDNPEKNKEARNIHTSAHRNPYRSNFNYWWQLIFAGIKESVGVTQKRQEELESIQEWIHNLKKQHEEKKTMRRKKATI